MSGRKIEKTKVDNQVKPASFILTKKELAVPLKAVEVSSESFSEYVRQLMRNWRQGTVGCKDRSMVALSGKKPWKQKGTGRARAGTARSPLWRGGGVIFGPQSRLKKTRVLKKVKRKIRVGILLDFLTNKKIIGLEWGLEGDIPKTSQAFKALKDTGLFDKKINLFLPIDDYVVYKSFVNIPNIRIVYFDQANAFDLADSDVWVFLKRDFENFKEMVSKWI